MTPRVGIVAYGMGNITSLTHALEAVGVDVLHATRPDDLADATHVILPGVGAFPKAMSLLHAAGFDDALRELAAAGRPLLGVCLGMQLLATEGEEHEPTKGLDIIPGRVVRIDAPGLRVPHMGWNDAVATRPSVVAPEGPSGCFYFVHSFQIVPDREDDVALVCDYGGPVVAGIARDNVVGVQFHPEKSHDDGLALLRRFVTC